MPPDDVSVKSRLQILLACTLACAFLFSQAASSQWLEVENLSPEVDMEADMDPVFEVYNGMLYAAWVTLDSNTSAGDDSDVVLRRHNGTGWGRIGEATPNDSGQDMTPSLAVYGDKLYLAWASNSEPETDGSDMDIIVKSYDGTQWSMPLELTSSLNSGMDSIPQTIVYGGELYVIWKTESADESTGFDADIVLRKFNGTGWSDTIEVSDFLDSGYDSEPVPAIYDGRLFIAWQSEDLSFTNGSDPDIVIRSYNGTDWSDVVEITSRENTGFDTAPSLAAHGGKLYCAWGTDDANETSGLDNDIVLKAFDGNVWVRERELTPKTDDGWDGYPELAVHSGRLYAFWQTNDMLTSTGNDPDIVFRAFDGSQWSGVFELNPDDFGRDGASFRSGVDIISFNEHFWIIWQSASRDDDVDWDITVRSCFGFPEKHEAGLPNEDGTAARNDDLVLPLLGLTAVIVTSLTALFAILRIRRGRDLDPKRIMEINDREKLAKLCKRAGLENGGSAKRLRERLLEHVEKKK